MEKIYICRIGEVFLKGKNRYLFLKKLKDNLIKSVSSIEGTKVESYHGRYVVIGPDSKELTDKIEKVFGLSSYSPAILIKNDIEDAKKTALFLIKKLPHLPPSFRVTAKRGDKTFPFTSTDIGKEVGAAVFMETKIPVSLKKFHTNIIVEIGPEISFVSIKKIKCHGGLPVGVSGQLEVLLSGGIDSPVAAWMMLKRGCTLNATTFYSPPYVGEEARDKVITLCKKMGEWGGIEKLHIIFFAEVQKKLRTLKPDKLAVILYRRMMVRVANIIALKNGAKALVTGEALGQVASQTLSNMIVIDEASTIPIFRPLVGMDKSEIIDIARKIDTFETSIIPHEDSCTLFMPPKPETKAKLEVVLRAEEKLNMEELALELVEKAEIIEF
jgi:tRNA uracil 4-sulfurtransferase